MSGWSKARKLFLTLFLVTVIALTGGWLWFKAQMEELVSNAENANPPSAEMSVEEWLDLSTSPSLAEKDAEGTEGNIDNSGQGLLATKHEPAAEGAGGSPGSTGQKPMTTNQQSKTPQPEQVDSQAQKLDQIKNKYKAELVKLQGEYEARLGGLLSSAEAEYRALKGSGSKAEIVALAQKYMGAGKALEAECNGKFYAVVNNMEAELKRNGLPTDIVNSVRAGYEGAKNERRKYLLGKAFNYM